MADISLLGKLMWRQEPCESLMRRYYLLIDLVATYRRPVLHFIQIQGYLYNG